jgi:hypothetical protein
MNKILLIISLITISSDVTLKGEKSTTLSHKDESMEAIINRVQPGQIWRHYKNKDYRIITVSCCAETLQWYVVYEALYDNEVSKIWHRPLDMFLETVKIDGITVPRFKHIE